MEFSSKGFVWLTHNHGFVDDPKTMLNEGLRIEIPCNVYGPTVRLIVHGLANGPPDHLLVGISSRNLVAHFYFYFASIIDVTKTIQYIQNP